MLGVGLLRWAAPSDFPPVGVELKNEAHALPPDGGATMAAL